MRCNTRDTISSITSSVITGAAGRAAASAFAADRFANGFAVGFVATGLSAEAVCEVGAKVDATGATGAMGAMGATGAIGLSAEAVGEVGAKVGATGAIKGAIGGTDAMGATGGCAANVDDGLHGNCGGLQQPARRWMRQAAQPGPRQASRPAAAVRPVRVQRPLRSANPAPANPPHSPLLRAERRASDSRTPRRADRNNRRATRVAACPRLPAAGYPSAEWTESAPGSCEA